MTDETLSVVVQRVDPKANAYRYYVLSIEPNLFEGVSLVKEWGRIGARGRSATELHPDLAGARVALDVWLRRKLRRGYVRPPVQTHKL